MTQDLKSSDINYSFWQGNNLYIRLGYFLVFVGGMYVVPDVLGQFIPNA
jgi:hypothetical protein